MCSSPRISASSTSNRLLICGENARTSGRRLVMFQADIVSSALMPDRNPSGLLKVLGVAFGLAIIVGNTIGSGILRSPGDVAAALPHPAWFIGAWVAGGVYALLGAMTMAELAVMIPKSGGQYVFARRALGEYPGFVVGWTDWVSSCGAIAAAAIALGELSAQ